MHEDLTRESPVGEKPTCYIASPCGFAESTRGWYRDELKVGLENLVDIQDPWEVYPDQVGETTTHADWVAGGTPEWRHAIALGETHYEAIRAADIVVAVLDQEPPDNGTVCEVAYAFACRKPVVGYRSDTRTSGEQGMPFNLMILAALAGSKYGGDLVTSLHDLKEAVRGIAERLRNDH